MILFALLIMFAPVILAESAVTCPSIATIKEKKSMWPYGSPWYPLYKENGELAFVKDIDNFSQQVTQFEHAEWSYHFSEAAHCFYHGSSNMMLVRDLPVPIRSNSHWDFSVNHELDQCWGSNENDCEFGGVSG